MARWLSRDGWLIFAACGIRSFAFGSLSVVLGLYLALLGFEVGAIGAIFAVALAGSAVMTVVLTTITDRLGRRRILILSAGLMALAGSAFALTDHMILLMVASTLGAISPSGKDIGPFLSIEQAILPQTSSAERRTTIFVAYNLVGSFAAALGALAVGLPAIFGWAPLQGYRLLLWAYVVSAALLLFLFAGLSRSVEARPTGDARLRFGFGVHRSSGVVMKLALLFAVDSFAGGFIVQSLVAYWFYLRYGVETGALGSIFFGANLLSGLSFLMAVPLARRIGLLHTMVFTHLFSNFLLILIPLMPNLQLAVAVFLVRHLLSQLDVPTRQSYVMAVVDPDERSATAGITSVARMAGTSLAPALAGWMLAAPALGLPFLFAGGLKIVYDLALFVLFRHVRPPEEASRAAKTIAATHG